MNPFDERRRNVRVGLIAAVAVAVAIALVVFVFGDSLRRDLVRYHVLFDQSVKGMVIGSKVDYRGIPVGAVRDIRFENGLTRVDIDVDTSRAPVQTVTTAALDRALVTGQISIELEGFELGAPRLGEGARIETRVGPLDELARGVPQVIATAGSALDRLDSVLLGVEGLLTKDNVTRVSAILANVESMTADGRDLITESRVAVQELREFIETSGGQVERVAGIADRAASSVQSLADQTSASVAHLTDDAGRRLRKTLESLQSLSQTAETAVARVDAMIGDRGQSLDGLLVGARDAVREFRMLVRRVKSAPESLLFGAEATPLELPAPGGRR